MTKSIAEVDVQEIDGINFWSEATCDAKVGMHTASKHKLNLSLADPAHVSEIVHNIKVGRETILEQLTQNSRLINASTIRSRAPVISKQELCGELKQLEAANKSPSPNRISHLYAII